MNVKSVSDEASERAITLEAARKAVFEGIMKSHHGTTGGTHLGKAPLFYCIASVHVALG